MTVGKTAGLEAEKITAICMKNVDLLLPLGICSQAFCWRVNDLQRMFLFTCFMIYVVFLWTKSNRVLTKRKT